MTDEKLKPVQAEDLIEGVHYIQATEEDKIHDDAVRDLMDEATPLTDGVQ